jgi:transcription elongation GreA/GreB family factor
MNIKRIKDCIGRGAWKEAENVWMSAVEDNPRPEAVREVLEAFVEADQAETAETLGWSLLDAHSDAAPEESVKLAMAALLAVPDSEELRKQTAELIKQAYGEIENFQEIYDSAGLETGQSPRRALRTIEVCRQITPGCYMGNRYEDRVIKIERLNPLGEYEFTEGRDKDSLEPKLLADEFDVLGAEDFRVMLRENREEIADLFQKDPGRVLQGLVIAAGGEMTSDELKDKILDAYISPKKWSSWWSRARNAVKKSDHLTIEGRNPSIITYHPGGLSLEQELASDVQAAKTAPAYLDVLKTYLAQADQRGGMDDEFVAGVMAAMADLARKFASRRRGDALQAVLCVEAAKQLGMAPPAEDVPAPSELIKTLKNPVDVIHELDATDLWPLAIEALRSREDAVDIFEKLFRTAPPEQLDAIAENLRDLGGGEVIDRAVEDAWNDPAKHIPLCAWTWDTPERSGETPNRVTMLSKLLAALLEIDNDWHINADQRREARQIVRNALGARDYAGYRETLDEMDQAMADVIRGNIERTDGLAQAVREDMLKMMRKEFARLFVKKKVNPWEDEKVLWTSAEGLRQREEELRVLKEVTMPANAKQIGEAAEQGDLRENADWQAAIEERDMLVSQARRMQAEMVKARIITQADVPDGKVSVGTRVKLKPASGGASVEIAFLGPWDSDPDRGIYSYQTGLAQSLMGRAVGESVEVKIAGREGEFEIENIDFAGEPSNFAPNTE